MHTEFHQVTGTTAGDRDGRECVHFKCRENEVGSPAVMGERDPTLDTGGSPDLPFGEEEAGPHMIPLLGVVLGEFRPE